MPDLATLRWARDQLSLHFTDSTGLHNIAGVGWVDCLYTRKDMDFIDSLIAWREGDPRFNVKELPMQAQYNLEIRLDAVDEENHRAMQGYMQNIAVFVQTTAAMLAQNGTKPKVVMYSDHNFFNHEQIPLLDDKMAMGLTELLGKLGLKVDKVEKAQPSPELMEAFLEHDREMRD